MRKLVLLLVVLLFVVTDALALPAFPKAKGFGTETTAGSGRHLTPPVTTVFKVTSLGDAGPGTLRDCAQATMPRVCVFETSGVITLTSGQIDILHPYLTIAGQTAPAPGIMIRGCGLRLKSHNILVQHLEIRPGDALLPSTGSCHPGVREGIGIVAEATEVYNAVFDHLSISWGLDENIGVGYNGSKRVRDVTFSHSLIYQGLFGSIHPDGPHSMGVLVQDGSKNISFYGNVLAHNKDRNIRTKANSTVEFMSNYVHNWGGISDWNPYNTDDGPTVLPLYHNIVSNIYAAGPDTPAINPAGGVTGTVIYVQKGRINPLSRFYVADLICPAGRNDGCYNALIPAVNRSATRAFPGSGATGVATADLKAYVLTNSGSRPTQRNPQDTALLSGLSAASGGMIDCIGPIHPKTGLPCPRNAGGWPERTTNVRPLAVPTDPNVLMPSGYTKLEEWIHGQTAALETGGTTATPAPTLPPSPIPTVASPAPTLPQVPTATATATATVAAPVPTTPVPSPTASYTKTPESFSVTGTIELTPIQ